MRTDVFFAGLLAAAALAAFGPVPPAVADGRNAAADASGAIESYVGPGAFDPSHQKALTYRDGEFVLQLHPSSDQLAVAVSSGGGRQFDIPLPDELAQADQLRRVQGDKAVVVGMASGDVGEVVLLDLRKGEVADKFLAYGPSVSPDGRYVAFVKFFPAHGSDRPTDEFLLYDVTRSAADNRRSSDAADDINVGVAVFPPGLHNEDADNLGIAQSNRLSIASDTFAWSNDSREYLFAADSARDRAAGFLSVVRVRMTSETPEVRVARIALQDYCLPAHPNCYVRMWAATMTAGKTSVVLGALAANPANRRTKVLSEVDFK